MTDRDLPPRFRHGWLTGPFAAFVALSLLACVAPRRSGWSQEVDLAQRADVFPAATERLDPKLATRYRAGKDRGETRALDNSKPEEAEVYYKRVAEKLDFPEHKPPATLDVLLEYFGYRVLKALDLDVLPSEVIMDRRRMKERYPDAPGDDHEFAGDDGPWDVLAAGYFAPKTSDVSGKSQKISWRKAVRLKPRAGSKAESDGLESMIMLSVIYVEAKNVPDPPFGSPSKNIQVLLINNSEKPGHKLEDGAIFLVFDPAAGYARTDHTYTSWDAADPAFADAKGGRKYYLPRACLQCHGGGDVAAATPHFFDTDYILDRVSPEDDFHEAFRGGVVPALVEAGINPNSEKYWRAVNVFRQLNAEILAHNERVASDSLAALGAKNWRNLHEHNTMHRLPIERGWEVDDDTTLKWSQDDPIDRELVPLLNRFCYRCHGTISYSVFDKQSLATWVADVMVNRLTEAERPFRMPLDRDLEKNHPVEYKRLVELLNEFKKEHTPD